MKLWDKISSLIAEEKGKVEGQQPASLEQPEDAKAAAGVGLEGVAGRPALSPADANTVLGMLPKGQSLDQFSAGPAALLIRFIMIWWIWVSFTAAAALPSLDSKSSEIVVGTMERSMRSAPLTSATRSTSS